MNELIRKKYVLWLQDEAVDDQTKQELRLITDQEGEIEERFYKDLEFGTGGLRGVIGAGTNRINAYTVGKATQGLAQFILERNSGGSKSVVIAYDSRNQSPEFALEAALVLAGNGIKAYVFESLRATPELSFAVRALGASGGIVITASHNPPEYNGYKVYDESGCQLVPHLAEQVTRQIGKVDSFAAVRRISRTEAEAQKLLVWIGEEMDAQFVQAVTSARPGASTEKAAEWNKELKIVYTPLHGAGNVMVRRVLQACGFTQVNVVKEQELPDSQFSTVASPNPEEREAFTLALIYARETKADIIIGTDPDCDRMGAVVRNKQGEYIALTGNQSGALMIYYVLSVLKERGALPANGVVVKTIVTGEMGAEIARSFGVNTVNTLTGFKYIGEQMTHFVHSGERKFLFGYEESYGYLAGDYCRDKDAVLASMLICEAAAYYKRQGKTLVDVLQELYEQYGYYREKLISRTLKGKDGLEQIRAIMEQWRKQPPTKEELGGWQIVQSLDYLPGLDGLPKENVLKFICSNGSWFCLRPSGTEPKIKIYLAARGATEKETEDRLERLSAVVLARIS